MTKPKTVKAADFAKAKVVFDAYDIKMQEFRDAVTEELRRLKLMIKEIDQMWENRRVTVQQLADLCKIKDAK